MPLNNPAPQFGLLTAYDMRAYSGVEVFSRSGGSAVSLPTFGTGEGVYEDALFFLHGRSSDTDNTAEGQIDTTNTFGASWAVTIDENDKIQITADVDFEVTTIGSSDPLGIGSATLSASLVGSDYVATAPNDWTRGALNLADVTYRVDEVGGANTFNFPALNLYAQDVTVFTRDRSTINDADVFGLDSLEKLDQAAHANGIAWLLTDDGYVQCSYNTALGHITWSSTELRDLLGFTGNESPSTYATSYSLLTATHKASGVLIPSRPYQRHHLRAENVGQSRRLIGGGYVSNHIGSYITSSLGFALDALLDEVDDYRQFTDRWVPYCSTGERVNLYLGWGDSRRALRSALVTGSQAAYDELYTSEDNGEYGRVRGSLTTNSFELVYPTRLKRRVPVDMEIEHL